MAPHCCAGFLGAKGTGKGDDCGDTEGSDALYMLIGQLGKGVERAAAATAPCLCIVFLSHKLITD